MEDVLNFCCLDNALPLVGLIILLEWVGSRLTERAAPYDGPTRFLAIIAFIIYSLLGIATWKPANAWDLIGIEVQALLAMGLVHGLARISLAFVGIAYLHTIGAVIAKVRTVVRVRLRHAEAAQRERARAEHARAERQKLADAERREAQRLAALPEVRPISKTQRIAELNANLTRSLHEIVNNPTLADDDRTSLRNQVMDRYLQLINEVERAG